MTSTNVLKFPTLIKGKSISELISIITPGELIDIREAVIRELPECLVDRSPENVKATKLSLRKGELDEEAVKLYLQLKGF